LNEIDDFGKIEIGNGFERGEIGRRFGNENKEKKKKTVKTTSSFATVSNREKNNCLTAKKKK